MYLCVGGKQPAYKYTCIALQMPAKNGEHRLKALEQPQSALPRLTDDTALSPVSRGRHMVRALAGGGEVAGDAGGAQSAQVLALSRHGSRESNPARDGTGADDPGHDRDHIESRNRVRQGVDEGAMSPVSRGRHMVRALAGGNEAVEAAMQVERRPLRVPE